MSIRVEIGKLRVRKDLLIRSDLSEDAVQRYMDLYQSEKEKAIKVQAKTNVIIDGLHRYEAAKRLGLEKVLVEPLDTDDRDLRTLAYKYNRVHGVPLSREERNRLISVLYLEDGKTQRQIAELMWLSESAIRKILGTVLSADVNNSGDERRELARDDYPVIARLFLGGEKQAEIAEKFQVSQGRISQVWAEMRDKVYKAYTEEKLLKREVAERVDLNLDEVDKILQEYGGPFKL